MHTRPLLCRAGWRCDGRPGHRSEVQLRAGLQQPPTFEIDVGGNLTDTYGSVGIYGLRAADAKSLMNGMTFNSMVNNNGGSDKQYFVNTADVQEVVLETSGLNAERETGGIQLRRGS